MKRKLITVSMLLLAGTLFSLVGCGGSGEDKKNGAYVVPEGGFDTTKDVEITFYSTMGDSLQSVYNAYIDEFNEIYPNIKVTHTQPTGGYNGLLEQVKTELSVGEGPDLTYCYSDHVALYNKTKSVVTLDNLMEDDDLGFTKEEYQSYIKGYLNEGRQFGDGLMYTLPFSKSTEVLYYNKTEFNRLKLQVPDHWFSEGNNDVTSMEYVCRELKKAHGDSQPLGIDSEANLFIQMTEQLQTPYTSASGEHFLFDNAENKAFVQKFKNLYDEGLLTTQTILASYTSSIFVDEKSYMSIGSSAGATHQVPSKNAEGNYPFEVGIAEIPQANKNNKKVISQGPSVAILNHGDDQKVMAAWLLAKFLTTNANFQAEFSIASGYVPVVTTVDSSSEYQKHLAKTEKQLAQYYTKGEEFWEFTDPYVENATPVATTVPVSSPNPGVDQKERIAAESAKLCLTQKDNYFTSPAFIGSSEARNQVNNLVVAYLSGTTTDINVAFKDAIDKCNASI